VIGRRVRRGVVVAGVGVVVAASAVSAAGAQAGSTTTTPTQPATGEVTKSDGITRTILGVTQPANAAGQRLVLQRVVIEPGARLAEHFHAGTQVARVERGRLVYRVVSGTASVVRANGKTREHSGPATVVLRGGDTIVEPAGDVHFGWNRSSKPVRIVLAALLSSDAGLSTPVGTDAPGTPLQVPADLTVTDSRLTTAGSQGQYTYGTVFETGTSTVGAEVRVDVSVQVSYTNGNGPFWGLMTLTFFDGSTIAATVTGATVATVNGGAQFASTVGVIGGTGRYENITGGSGTYQGSRPTAVGTAPLATVTDLRVVAG
jgi:quercetin dioxygenase-like cupin family protein